MLTEKQRDLLLYIIQYQDQKDGVSPSYRELATHLGQNSPAPVHNMVRQLVKRGFIEKPLEGSGRALKVVKHPDGSEVIPSNNVLHLEHLGFHVVATSIVPEGELWVRPSDAKKISA